MQRLTAHPPYVLAGAAWIDPRVRGHVAALADPETGYARDVNPVGLPWQEPDEARESTGRVDLNAAIDTEGRLTETRSDLGQRVRRLGVGAGEGGRARRARARAGRLRRARRAALGRARSGRLHRRRVPGVGDGRRAWRWMPLPRWPIRCAGTPSATTSPSW